MKHLSFIEWLKKEEYVGLADYYKLMDEGQLRSLKKSKSDYRVNAFNAVFSDFI